MVTRTYRLRGSVQDGVAPPIPEPAHDAITSHRRVIPGRARDGSADEVLVAADEVVRIELDNGFVLWSRADDLVREHGQKSLSRDGDEAWEFGQLATSRELEQQERGLFGFAIKVLDFFGINLADEVAERASSAFEDRLLRGRAPGLFHCALAQPPITADGELTLVPVEDGAQLPAGDGPILVFIHGTASSCNGSFGKLWDAGSAHGANARKQLLELYKERVFAFEHRTLTESPIVNALALARALPAGAELHLVSHSRGGMIGELLCLGECEHADTVLSSERLRELFAADRTVAEQLGLSPLDERAASERDRGYEKDREALASLLAELHAKRFRVRRFVRVACPARGTTLASGRLDRWLSMMNFLVGKAVGVGLFTQGLDFLLAVVKRRTDPRTLPGLEAMMPGSALTRLLNHGELVTTADLTVISGDIEGESFWQRLKIVATDWFYGADHDLVVNTGSMSGGLRRGKDRARYQRNAGPEVYHFTYFSQALSVRWLVAGLTRIDGDSAGFLSLEAAQKEAPRWREAVARGHRAEATPRPLAVVLPGTMGTHLSVGERHIWLRYLALLRGGLKELRIDAREVTVGSVIDDFYGPLLEFLSRTHRVEVFGYDWRRSVRDSAFELARRLEELLPRAEREGQPVHLVAHSMGGLVVRAMIADRGAGAAVWDRITRLPNSRFLMLGTPNHGSYEAVRWLTGLNPTQAKLSLLDFTQSASDIVNIVNEYPGLCELLPFGDEDDDFADVGRWERLKEETGGRWKPAETKVLRDASTTWSALRQSPTDSTVMCYVAGSRPSTIVDYQLADVEGPADGLRKRIVFEATAEGDGTVTWASGALPDVPFWYAENVEHDALCASSALLPAYLEILQTGKTARLTKVPPKRRRDVAAPSARFLLPPTPPTDGIPGEDELSSLGFGGGLLSAGSRASPAPLPSIEVSVRHGDLSYARNSVLVGHYAGDTIVSAEAVLNRQLHNVLAERLALGVYPGPLGTHAVFFNTDPYDRPPGAIVVGLGQVGELTPGLLEARVRDALIEYALQVARWPDGRFGPPGSPRKASVSSLLVGTGAGGIPVRDSLEAILRGAVAANSRLSGSRMDQLVTIDKLDFIEMFEDVAIAAVEQLAALLADGELETIVRWPQRTVVTGEAGRRRVRFDEAPGWWQRLEIVDDPHAPGVLRFIASTDRARAEVTMTTGQLALAEHFIRASQATTAQNADTARTLFDLLLPLRLRELAPRQGDLVLVVDERSARYPWELLEDRWSDRGRPPAVRSGLIRQLKTRTYRSAPAHAFKNTALVIASPDLGGSTEFADLPGARSEGQRVAALLAEKGYHTVSSIDGTTAEIVPRLHQDAWRILHLSGHGVFERRASSVPGKEDTIAGMVIGRNEILGGGDVSQMRWVPELVFINCCHLGKTQAERTADLGQMAANLGVAFIEMGARAVIAAGWAVADDAAVTFAEVFYRRMLDGEEFGEAVRAAREQIWLRHGAVNTWGAYQCYGDPSFRLSRDGAASHGVTRKPYSAPVELVADLDNLASAFKADGPGSDDPERAPSRISACLERVSEENRDEWRARADVCGALGLAWGEAGFWREAIEELDRAIAADRGDCPIRVIEQCANYRVRLAAQQWRSLRSEAPRRPDLDEQRDRLTKHIEQSLRELDLLCQRAPTTERLNLLGAACKRLAVVAHAGAPRHEALVNMAHYYGLALALKPSRYSYTNWATAKLLAASADPSQRGGWEARLDGDLLSWGERSTQQLATDPSFWEGAGLADIDTVRLLMCALEIPTVPASLEGELAQLTASIVDRYRRAFRRAASVRQRSSVVEHLEFLCDMSDQHRLLLAGLQRIVREIA